MAAYAALVSLMNDLELMITNHPTRSFSFDQKQIASLSQTVDFLIKFMETYDSDACSRQAAQVLEMRIASAAHEAHDVVESHVVDQIHARPNPGGEATTSSSHFLDFIKRKAMRIGFALLGSPYFLVDLKKAIDNMDSVKREAMQFQAKSELKAEQSTYSAPSISSEPSKNAMVGFDEVILRLMGILTGEPSNQRLVIPIEGMGGLGKTTLAKNVYEHSYVEQHFDVLLWATISQKYSAEYILKQLLSGERKSTTGGNARRLGEELHKKLCSRKYLIVLDDMWSVKAWDEIQMFLPDNQNGSRVIVTTRLSNLAAHLSSSPFEVSFLDDKKSWELFREKAFEGKDCPVELEKTGKKIVERCGGLPLSIVVIAGNLRRSSRAIEYWEKVADCMNPISTFEEDDQCLNILSLSYHHLPPSLKPCFLYMGVFREDERIDASDLVKFWVVEGFLKPNEALSAEEVAEDYLKDLIDRNLILVRERSWNGKVLYCEIHDIVRELCLKVGKKEKFMCVLEDTTTIQGIQSERRIVIPEGKLNSDVIASLQSALLLRSLILRHNWSIHFDEYLVELTQLRLLRLLVNIGCLPDANFQQVNLRYLAFSCGKSSTVRRFTEKLCFPLFWNMQTLIIRSIGVDTVAPYEIWEMPQLRHLEFIRVRLPNPVPDQECIVLQNLHTLEGVVNFKLTEEVCKRMPNIKKLSVSYDSFPSDCKASLYYCLHNLVCFNKLKSLRCEFGIGSKWRDVVVGNFAFPTSLEELCLWNSHMHWEDLTVMIRALPRLGSLQLNSVQGSEWNLDEEEFPHLKVLKITRCRELNLWSAKSSNFPILEILHFSGARHLEEIPLEIGEIPTLRRIELVGCSVSAAVSAISILVEQERVGNEDIEVDVHFSQMKKLQRFQIMVQEKALASKSFHLHLAGFTSIDR